MSFKYNLTITYVINGAIIFLLLKEIFLDMHPIKNKSSSENEWKWMNKRVCWGVSASVKRAKGGGDKAC